MNTVYYFINTLPGVFMGYFKLRSTPVTPSLLRLFRAGLGNVRILFTAPQGVSSRFSAVSDLDRFNLTSDPCFPARRLCAILKKSFPECGGNHEKNTVYHPSVRRSARWRYS